MKHLILSLLLCASVMGAEFDLIEVQRKPNPDSTQNIQRAVPSPANSIRIIDGSRIPSTLPMADFLKSANNLSDLGDVGIALDNLGGSATGKNIFQKPDANAVRYIRINADNSVDFLDAAAFLAAIGGGGGGSGTVTTVSVVTANGVSAVVANPTTTPALTFTLGAITPTSVNGITLSGSGSLSNVGTTSLTGFTGSGSSSGTNTGDQTDITGNAGTATALQTGRTFSVSTDATGTSAAFNGTGNVTIPLTLANDVVTNAKAANMAQSTIKGRAAGAGTGDPTDLTSAQATAILDQMVGDSGGGVTKGLVPAATTGNSTTHFLRKDGTWTAPAGSGGNVTTSDTLTLGRVMIGNGGTDIKKIFPDGSSTEVLHGGASPAFGKVSLTSDVIGTLPQGNGGTGNSAGSADHLTTTGTKVTVSGAAPPTTGQTLTATSATTATWQSPPTTAFVNYGNVAADVSGTYSQSGSTQVQVTIVDHGHIVGHVVWLDFTTGGISANDQLFIIDGIVSADTFTVTRAASTTTSGNVTSKRWQIRNSKGVHSVSNIVSQAGLTYTNFSPAFADANYEGDGNSTNIGAGGHLFVGWSVARTAQACSCIATDFAGTPRNAVYVDISFNRYP